MDATTIRQRLALPAGASDEELASALSEVIAYLATLEKPDCGVALHSRSAPTDLLAAVRMQSDPALVSYHHNIALMQREMEAMREQVARSKARAAIDVQASQGRVIPSCIIETLVELHMRKPDEAVQMMKCLPCLDAPSPFRGIAMGRMPASEIRDE